MTVAATAPIITYEYTGPADYDFPFRVFTETDVVISHIDLDGVTTVLTIGIDYTVLLTEGIIGGTSILTYAPTTGTITMLRRLPLTQTTDWVNNGPFDMELLEQDFDKNVMLLQEMQVSVDGAYVVSTWRGDWEALTYYSSRDTVENSATGNIYISTVDHISGSDFDADLAAGIWSLMIDLEAVEAARLDAEESAAEALASETAALASETAASLSETSADTDATTASTQAGIATSAATAAQLDAWTAEAEKLTAASYADEAEDVFVKIYTSDGDGTFTATDTTEYSALHWAAKAEEATSFDPDDYVSQSALTGSAELPVGTTLQRDAIPADGLIRYNSDEAGFEGYSSGEWGALGGGGGGLAWEASASGDVTAVAGIGYLTYTDTATRNVNLPAGVVGESVGINDVSQNCGTNSITIITSGSEKFMGLVENFILDIDGSSIVATYADATNGWVITGGNW